MTETPECAVAVLWLTVICYLPTGESKSGQGTFGSSQYDDTTTSVSLSERLRDAIQQSK